MAKYITLYQFTDQGIKSYENTVQRTQDAAAAVERMGGKLLSVNWTIGPHDLVSIRQFPDERDGNGLHSQARIGRERAHDDDARIRC